MSVFPLAIEGGRKRLAHREVEAFFNRVGHAAGRRHALAKHQLYLGGRREPPVAGQRCKTQRGLVCHLVQPLCFKQREPVSAFNESHRHLLAQAIHRTPHIGLHTGQRGRAIELQREKLLFVDAAALVGANVLYKRPAGVELEAGSARQVCTLGGLEPGFGLRGTTHSGWQISRKIKRPFALIHPAAVALAGLCIAAAQGDRSRRFGVTKVNGRLVKLHHHLVDPRYLALGREARDLKG